MPAPPGTGIRAPRDGLRAAVWRAGLDDVRLHDCRHSFASQALALGEGLPVTTRLLGHKTLMTTVKYAHLARNTERASAAKVGDSFGNDLLSLDPEDDEAEAA